jgi:hypothetical protein
MQDGGQDKERIRGRSEVRIQNPESGTKREDIGY